MVVIDAVDDEIVDDTTTVIAQQVVLRLPGTDAVEVVCDHRVQPRDRAWPNHLGVAHVRDIEDADVLAHGGVLCHGADVLDRHVPAAEVGHLGAEIGVTRVQRGLAQGHALTVAPSASTSRAAVVAVSTAAPRTSPVMPPRRRTERATRARATSSPTATARGGSQ